MKIDSKTLTRIFMVIRECFTWSDTYKSYFKKGRNNRCEICCNLFIQSECHLDHYIEPVTPYDKRTKDMSVQEYYDRVWTLPVRILCRDCHKDWTKQQRKLRK